MPIIGIDFGTTNSAIAIYQNNLAEIIPNKQHERTTPSVLQIQKNGEEIIGTIAKNSIATYPEATISEVKRLIGTGEKISIHHKTYDVEYLAAKIINYLKSCAEASLQQTIKRAVITIPANFNNAQRQAIKDAGEIANLKIDRIISEPTAAALAFCYDNLQTNRNLLVYDLGGGTFDVSIVQMLDKKVIVKASDGDNQLGGKDFDQALMTYVKDAFQKEKGYSMDSIALDALVLEQTLKQTVEQAKINLTSQVEVDINLPFIGLKDNFPVSFQHTIRKATFEELIYPYIMKTIEKVEACLHAADIHAQKIDDVLLVGGSSRIPFVRERIQTMFPNKIRTNTNPDEIIAKGAAIQSALIHDVLGKTGKDLDVQDISPYTIGMATGFDGLFDPFIYKNTRIPHQVIKEYTTLEDNQTIAYFNIYQGEKEYVKDNILISRGFAIDGIPRNKAGEEDLILKIGYDANGLIEIEASIVSTGKTVRYSIQTQVDVLNEKEKSHAIYKFNEEEKKSLLFNEVKQLSHQEEKLMQQVSSDEKERLGKLLKLSEHAIEDGSERLLLQAQKKLADVLKK